MTQGTENWCVVALNDIELMIIGGESCSKCTLIYNRESNVFTDGPSLNDHWGSTYGACTKFQSPMHENRMVVMSIGHEAGKDVVELLDYTQENAQWTISKYFE